MIPAYWGLSLEVYNLDNTSFYLYLRRIKEFSLGDDKIRQAQIGRRNASKIINGCGCDGNIQDKHIQENKIY